MMGRRRRSGDRRTGEDEGEEEGKEEEELVYSSHCYCCVVVVVMPLVAVAMRCNAGVELPSHSFPTHPTATPRPTFTSSHRPTLTQTLTHVQILNLMTHLVRATCKFHSQH